VVFGFFVVAHFSFVLAGPFKNEKSRVHCILMCVFHMLHYFILQQHVPGVATTQPANITGVDCTSCLHKYNTPVFHNVQKANHDQCFLETWLAGHNWYIPYILKYNLHPNLIRNFPSNAPCPQGDWLNNIGCYQCVKIRCYPQGRWVIPALWSGPVSKTCAISSETSLRLSCWNVVYRSDGRGTPDI
jgi:hypothetical protein